MRKIIICLLGALYFAGTASALTATKGDKFVAFIEPGHTLPVIAIDESLHAGAGIYIQITESNIFLLYSTENFSGSGIVTLRYANSANRTQDYCDLTINDSISYQPAVSSVCHGDFYYAGIKKSDSSDTTFDFVYSLSFKQG